MNIKQVEYFLAACDGGTFTGAARELGVSVQAVSKAVCELEREMGEPLFERTERGVTPTETGRQMRSRAAAFVASLRDLEAFMETGETPDVQAGALA